ncbi:hypothetical protein HGA89_02485 [bacterium]|nr:hypothetical protein [bacterium]
MRNVIVMLLILAITGTAMAQDLSNHRNIPAKNTPIVQYISPENTRQGGEDILSALAIVGLPYSDSGTTIGYADDYDVACPYSGSTSPDVVYSYTPMTDLVLTVDLCGSDYDTKAYIIDDMMNVVGCNDDFYYDATCGVYVSLAEGLLTAGTTYYVIIDGYGGDFGNYQLYVTGEEPCLEVVCPADAVPEGEPTLYDGYVDEYNSGCNGELGNFMTIDWTNDEDGVAPYDGYAWLCGVSGWHLGPLGEEFRDTDWYSVTALNTGMMEVSVESLYPTYLFKLAPTDCALADVELQANPVCGTPGVLSFPVTAGEVVWLWVGPTEFTGPVYEFPYFMTVTNNVFNSVSNEDMNWGQVKSLFK